MTFADELVRTQAEKRSLAVLRDATGEVEGDMERHCLRCFELGVAIAERRGAELDREVLLCAAILHDIGLYDAVSEGGVYTEEGGALARRIGLEEGWDPARAELCAEACARHHSITSKWDEGAEVEVLRLSDRIEVFGGIPTGGLPRAEVREIFARHSRKGFYRALLKLVGSALRSRPQTLPAIFKP